MFGATRTTSQYPTEACFFVPVPSFTSPPPISYPYHHMLVSSRRLEGQRDEGGAGYVSAHQILSESHARAVIL